MRFLSRRTHVFLDGGAALAFLVAPTALRFFDTPAAVSYALAAVYLLLALSAASAFGRLSAVPFAAHGAVEAASSAAAIAVSLLLSFEPAARYFFVAAGFVLFLAWAATDYRGDREDGAD